MTPVERAKALIDLAYAARGWDLPGIRNIACDSVASVLDDYPMLSWPGLLADFKVQTKIDSAFLTEASNRAMGKPPLKLGPPPGGYRDAESGTKSKGSTSGPPAASLFSGVTSNIPMPILLIGGGIALYYLLGGGKKRRGRR